MDIIISCYSPQDTPSFSWFVIRTEIRTVVAMVDPPSVRGVWEPRSQAVEVLPLAYFRLECLMIQRCLFYKIFISFNIYIVRQSARVPQLGYISRLCVCNYKNNNPVLLLRFILKGQKRSGKGQRFTSSKVVTHSLRRKHFYGGLVESVLKKGSLFHSLPQYPKDLIMLDPKITLKLVV